MRLIKYIICAFVLIFAIACQKEESEQLKPLNAHQFVALELNQPKIFKIDSLIFDEFTGGKVKKQHFQKWTIIDHYQNTVGDRVYRLKIESRLNDTLSWCEKRMDKLLLNEKRFEQSSENITRIVLVFPIVDKLDWDANALNTKVRHEYSYHAVNRPYNFNGKQYDATLSVIQNDEENLIEKRFTQEKYAKDIGYFYRKDINLRTSFEGDTLSGYICQWSLEN